MIKVLRVFFLVYIILTVSGCKSSYFQPREVDKKPTIVNRVVHIEEIDGHKEKVKEMHYDTENTLREETFYKNQLTDIVKTYNNEGHQIKEEKYKNGNILLGQRKIYFRNGNIKEQYEFSGSRKHGRYFSYYSDGTLESDQKFHDNNLVENCTWYYSSGSVRKIINFGQNESYQVDYYENGEKKSEGAFVSDSLSRSLWVNGYVGDSFAGKWIWYDKEGVISKEKFYSQSN